MPVEGLYLEQDRGLAQTQLIPIAELTPGAVGAIRNKVIEDLVAFAEYETKIPRDRLIVRDVLPLTDLQLYIAPATAGTREEWIYLATTATGYHSWTGGTGAAARTNPDQRFIALFGVRDLRTGIGTHATSSASTARCGLHSHISLVRIRVGGATKAIWDITSLEAYNTYAVGFTPSAVIIPEDKIFEIDIYKKDTTNPCVVMIQLIGVTVEARGRLINP